MSRKQGRGRPLDEMVKGSLDYEMARVRQAFRAQFPSSDAWWPWIEEIFGDHVIVHDDTLQSDEYWHVPYTREEGQITFAARETWEAVELTYQPQSRIDESNKGPRQRLVERVADSRVRLVESEGGLTGRITAIGLTADTVNGNGRRYPARVVEAAVRELRGHLHESAGQGRLIQVLGEAEHPSDKPTRRPNILETVCVWDDVAFDGAQVILEGHIVRTSKGQDILALMEGGVRPDISQRAYGNVKTVTENGLTVEEVTELHITGYDFVLEGSDLQAGVTMVESRDDEERAMELEELRKKYPDLVRKIEEEHDAKKRAEMERSLAERARADAERQRLLAEHDRELREMLGLGETDDLTAALESRERRLQEMEEAERARQVADYIDTQMAEIKYPEFLKVQFVESVKAAGAKSIEEAKAAIVAKRKEYDAIVASMQLERRGFQGVGVQVLGPVIEEQLGIPAYAAAAWQLQESLVRSNLAREWDHRKPKSVNERFAAEYLRRFDEVYARELKAEARLFEEAEQASDLSLPYSVMRAVVAEAFPELVATSIFDAQMINEATTRLYFEAYEGETGYSVDVTNEDVTADRGDWVALDYKRVTPGSVAVKNTGGDTTYVEGSDYVIDYANGRLMALTGDISDEQALKVSYTYTAIRKGEMAAIERGKVKLSYITVDALADRLATQISNEAIVFSRAQMSYDAVTRTLASLVRQVRRKTDQGILYAALAAVLQVASNSGGTWTASSGDLDDLIKYIGLAKVKVANRYYEPTGILMSATNGDRVSNWDGFKRDGFPDAILNANGFIGRVKGLPAFESTEFSDAYILAVTRDLVMHRVFQPMQLKGPYPTYDVSAATSKLIAADQYYAEEYNLTEAPVPEKGAYVVIT